MASGLAAPGGSGAAAIRRLPVTRTRVKFCGITTADDARAAARAGADAIGLLFWSQSERGVDAGRAREVAAALPPFVTRVGVFVDPQPEFVEQVLQTVRLDVLQFHGSEQPAECSRYRLPYIKALQVREGVDLHDLATRHSGAQGLLLDAFHAALPGGSGETFDWRLIPADLALPVVIAGGLHAGNVGEAIRRVRPWAVDVSGGIESRRGVKDPAKMSLFIDEVRRVEAD